MYLFFFLVIVTTVDIVFVSARKDKRLLINDPDVILNRLEALEQMVKLQASEIQRLKSEPPKLTGSTYMRWGRKQCPGNQTEMVYSGFAGGGHYDQTGSASDYACLSPDPTFDKTSGPDTGRMYGGEYERDTWASDADDEDVPCALCRTNYATTIMIPGTNFVIVDGTENIMDIWHRDLMVI